MSTEFKLVYKDNISCRTCGVVSDCCGVVDVFTGMPFFMCGKCSGRLAVQLDRVYIPLDGLFSIEQLERIIELKKSILSEATI